jgi:hypothetical protein
MIENVTKTEFIEKSVKMSEDVATHTLDALEAVGEKAFRLFIKEVRKQSK